MYHWHSSFEEMESLRREMGRFLDHLSSAKRPMVVCASCTWEPEIDVYETEEEIVVLADAAGMNRDLIELIVDQNVLTIRGERRVPAGVGQRYHLAEIRRGAFERTVELPLAVQADQARATYEDGFLEIVLPKAQEAVPRKVVIKTH